MLDLKMVEEHSCVKKWIYDSNKYKNISRILTNPCTKFPDNPYYGIASLLVTAHVCVYKPGLPVSISQITFRPASVQPAEMYCLLHFVKLHAP